MLLLVQVLLSILSMAGSEGSAGHAYGTRPETSKERKLDFNDSQVRSDSVPGASEVSWPPKIAIFGLFRDHIFSSCVA